jgi:predicted nucleic acid-binding protein
LSACVLDTDVVIASLDRADAHHERAVAAIGAIIASRVDLLMSTVNYAEALVRPAGDDRVLRRAVEAIRALGIRPVAPTAPMAIEAARLRGLGISLPDGFALATAKAERASVASFDRRVQRAVADAGIELAAQLR